METGKIYPIYIYSVSKFILKTSDRIKNHTYANIPTAVWIYAFGIKVLSLVIENSSAECVFLVIDYNNSIRISEVKK